MAEVSINVNTLKTLTNCAEDELDDIESAIKEAEERGVPEDNYIYERLTSERDVLQRKVQTARELVESEMQ